MTRALPFTQASLRRAIAAARKAGLRVAGIRPDGTLILSDEPCASADDGLARLAPDGHPAAPSKWDDVEA